MRRVLLIVFGCCFCFMAEGQDYAKHVKFTVDKMRLDDRVEYREEGPALGTLAPTTSQRWWRIEMIYELDFATNAPRGDYYLNEMQFDWTVILPVKDANGKPSEKDSVRYTKQVKYGDVLVKGEHRAVLYIHPQLFERYQKELVRRDTMFVRCRVTIAGKTRMIAWFDGDSFTPSAEEPEAMFPRTPTRGSWFRSEEIRQGAGGLLTRLETPWAYASFDQFELIMPNER